MASGIGSSPKLPPELLALLEAVRASSRGMAQAYPSALGSLSAAPPIQPAQANGMTPEEIAALAAAKGAPPPGGITGDHFKAMEQLWKPKEGEGMGDTPLGVFGSILKGMRDEAAARAGQAGIARLESGVGLVPPPAAPDLPLQYGPPIPPEGPPIPSIIDQIRASNRAQFGLDQATGQPQRVLDAAAALQAQALNPTYPQADPMAGAAGSGAIPIPSIRPPIDSVNTGRGMPAMDPTARQEANDAVAPGLASALPEGSAAQYLAQLIGGIPGAVSRGISNYGSNIEVDRPFGAPSPNAPAAEAAKPAGPKPAFTYKFPGAAGTPQQAQGGWSETTIDTRGVAQNTGAQAQTGIGSYMSKLYGAESGSPQGRMVPNAAGASSAFGPAQFTDGTWVDTVQQHDPETFKAHRGSKASILKLREDPVYHDRMAKEFTLDNARILSEKGYDITDANLYAMHFFGKGAGPKVIAADPNTPISKLVDADAIAANPHLAGKTAGQALAWAANTINKSGGAYASGGNAYGLPERTPREVAEYPAPPDMPMPVGTDYSKMMEELRNAAPTKGKAPDPLDNLITILGGMAAGAAGAPSDQWGRVVAGLGAGAAQGAGLIEKQANETEAQFQDRKSRFHRTLAEAQQVQAEGTAKTANQRAEVGYGNQKAKWETAVKNSDLARAERNAAIEYGDKIDYKIWEMGQPQVQANEKGISVITKTPDGKINIKTQQYKSIDDQLKQIKARQETLGADDMTTRAMMYQQAATAGDLGVRRAMLMNAASADKLADILGPTEFANLQKKIDKDIPNAAVMKATKTEQYKEAFTQRATDLLMQLMLKGELNDSWIEKMAASGDPAALAMTQGARQNPNQAPLSGSGGDAQIKGGAGNDQLVQNDNAGYLNELLPGDERMMMHPRRIIRQHRLRDYRDRDLPPPKPANDPRPVPRLVTEGIDLMKLLELLRAHG